MKEVTFRKWNSSPQYTTDFSIITKQSDLGESLYKKTILGFYINGVNNTAATDDSNVEVNYVVKIWYRDNKETWTHLASIPHSVYGGVKGNFYYKTMLNTPVEVQDIQLRITGNPIRGDFRINDFGLVFRKSRTSSKTRLD